MQKIIQKGKVTEVYLNDEEYRAFELISLGKDLGLPPRDTMKELRDNNLKGNSIRAGSQAYLLSKKGTEVFKRKGPMIKDPGWDSFSRLGDR